MAVLKRCDIAEPVLPKETVEVTALGGEVVVRGLLLSEQLHIHARILAATTDKTTPDGVHSMLPVLLARCVLDADGACLFTEEQWQIFGAKESAQAVSLFNVAWRLSGLAEADTEKN